MRKEIGELEYDRFLVPYRLYGESTEKIIVCVSGAKQTMSAWRSLVSYFVKDYRIVVFDMPGQGRSQIKSGACGVTLDEQVNVLHQLLISINLNNSRERFLIGGSWGSIVSAVYAGRYPDVFHRIILGSFGTKPNSVLNSIIHSIQRSIEQGRGADIAPMMIEQFGQYLPQSLKRQIISQFKSMSQQQLQSFYEHSVFVTRLGDLKSHMNLNLIAVPALVIMGQFDTIMDLFDTRQSAKLIPQSRFHLVKGVGHFLHWEQPKILDIYQSFLRENALDSASSQLA